MFCFVSYLPKLHTEVPGVSRYHHLSAFQDRLTSTVHTLYSVLPPWQPCQLTVPAERRVSRQGRPPSRTAPFLPKFSGQWYTSTAVRRYGGTYPYPPPGQLQATLEQAKSPPAARVSLCFPFSLSLNIAAPHPTKNSHQNSFATLFPLSPTLT